MKPLWVWADKNLRMNSSQLVSKVHSPNPQKGFMKSGHIFVVQPNVLSLTLYGPVRDKGRKIEVSRQIKGQGMTVLS